jgi:hypothetical protein
MDEVHEVIILNTMGNVRKPNTEIFPFNRCFALETQQFV